MKKVLLFSAVAEVATGKAAEVEKLRANACRITRSFHCRHAMGSFLI